MEPDETLGEDAEPTTYEPPRVLERVEIVGHLAILQS
jgi:hypothetical protein